MGRKELDLRYARVSLAIGVFPYFKKAVREEFFDRYMYAPMQKVGSHWLKYNEHGELLRSFVEVGGLTQCPDGVRAKILKWLLDTYLGEPGGMTSYGNVRHVFYSDTAAPLIENIVKSAGESAAKEIEKFRNDRFIAQKLMNQHVARRFEQLLDLSSTK